MKKYNKNIIQKIVQDISIVNVPKAMLDKLYSIEFCVEDWRIDTTKLMSVRDRLR